VIGPNPPAIPAILPQHQQGRRKTIVDPLDEQHEPLPGHPVRVNPSPAPVHTPTLHAGWLVAAVAVVVVLGVVLLPKYLLAWDLNGGPAPTDRARAVNDIRTTLLQGLGGAALLVGAYFTWRQVQVAREGQLTERFTTAVGQLSNRSVDVRLGGIYALERIAIDSERDRQTTYEVLCAYVRQHAPVRSPDSLPTPDDRRGGAAGLAAKRELAWEAGQRPPLRVRDADIQAAMSVLGRRLRVPGHQQLELSRVALQRASLRQARLAGADLHYSDLSAADLSGADLQLADLTGIRLAAAVLISANLHQADLRTAILWHVRLDDADLRGTDLAGADLSGAHLPRARLEQADLRGADLSGTDLSSVHLDAAVADPTTVWPQGFDPSAAGVIITPTGPPIRPQTTWLWPR
jgi:Pentapeptide repeats (8 copies)